MQEIKFVFDNVRVTLIDKSSNNERNQRLVKPLQEFYRAVEREKHEKGIKEKRSNNYRSNHAGKPYDAMHD